jgi:tetraacyldisaccharide 4'-kinase
MRRAERLQAKAGRVNIPVIVVGNITVGGSGKTPTVIALAQWLKARDHCPAVVSRGYGGREIGPIQVEPKQPERFGDEPSLMAQRLDDVPVVVGRDRLAAAQMAESLGATVIISDDGLQHYRMARDIELVLIDSERGLGNGLMLPFGPLREPTERLTKVDLLLSVGQRTAAIATERIALKEGAVYPLNAGHAKAPVKGETVHAVTGIANPQRFFQSLRCLGYLPLEHAWPDHHRFDGSEIRFQDGYPVMVTEKDAVKLKVHNDGANVWVLPVDAQLPDGLYEMLISRLSKASLK